MGCYNYNLAKRRKTKGEGQNFVLADRISELPDEILVSILSLLSLKEAATTSILSKRWQHLWASTMTLNFDAKLDLGSSNLRHFRGLQSEIRYQESHRYINWVNRVLDQHKGPQLNDSGLVLILIIVSQVPLINGFNFQ
ncbi:F-box/FBD/LRR-repeat protein [Prunus yedoensis var. nudiflora]|uniref:F-box/FBD/LRR-repeat protein n=1 Tax=Prunus yedoensis var. nudiflora TaxID=2094558 RepID=A0A314XQZ0_PRUYE|nr:F-box/FBD/LRR-repeat protein [Prunus yedoensis var. nudiflora]